MYDNKKGTDSVEKKTEKELLGAVEAILFAMGESVSLSKIASAIGKDETEAKRLLEELKKTVSKERAGNPVDRTGGFLSALYKARVI